MFNFINYFKSGLASSAIVAMSLGLSSGAVLALDEEKEEDKKEGARVVKVDCNKGDDVQDVLDQYPFETKPLVLIIEGICESDETVEVTRNNVEFVGAGPYEQRGYITGVLEVEGGRGVYIGDNMELDLLVVEYGQVFLDAGEGAIVINSRVGVNFQSVLSVGAEEPNGSVTINSDISLINQSLLLIQQDELASAGTVTTGGIFATLQSSLNVRDASIGIISLDSDSHAFLDFTARSNGDELGTILCDSQSRVWGPINGEEFDPTGCLDIN